jgi:hypothetical protein
MNKLYFRGIAYDFEVTESNNERAFALYKDGELFRIVNEEELDIRSRVSLILDAYYSTVQSTTQNELLTRV